MNYFEAITKYLPQAVDKYFAEDSKSVILEHGSKFIDVNFNEAGYVKVADMLLDGLSNYYRTQENLSSNDLPGYSNNASDMGTGFAAYAGNTTAGRDGFDIGGTSIRWEIYKLQWCRGRQFRIDHISNEETAKVVTGHLIEEFHRLKVIPEVDACRFSTIADSASISLGNLLTETIAADGANPDLTESTILAKFFAARKWLVEHEVPLEDLVWFVSPDVYTLIMNSDKLTKFITQEDYRGERGITFEVKKFNDVPLIEVTPSRFFTGVQVTRNGYQASSTSKAINYMLCSKKAVLPIRKIEYQKMYDEDMSGLAGFYGTMMNYLLYHGCIIPRNKLVGTVVSVRAAGTALSKVNQLSIDTRAGQTTNGWVLKAYFTQPSGLRGQVVFSVSNAFTVGNSVTITGDTDSDGNIEANEIYKVDLDQQIVDATNTAYYFALVDYRGICIAKTPAAVAVIKK